MNCEPCGRIVWWAGDFTKGLPKKWALANGIDNAVEVSIDGRLYRGSGVNYLPAVSIKDAPFYRGLAGVKAGTLIPKSDTGPKYLNILYTRLNVMVGSEGSSHSHTVTARANLGLGGFVTIDNKVVDPHSCAQIVACIADHPDHSHSIQSSGTVTVETNDPIIPQVMVVIDSLCVTGMLTHIVGPPESCALPAVVYAHAVIDPDPGGVTHVAHNHVGTLGGLAPVSGETDEVSSRHSHGAAIRPNPHKHDIDPNPHTHPPGKPEGLSVVPIERLCLVDIPEPEEIFCPMVGLSTLVEL
jgi:hypothetical protein